MKNVKVLGSECCKTCTNLKEKIEYIIEENNIEGNVKKITNITEVLKYGVMSSPSVVVDEEVKCSGRIPSEEELLEWLK